MLLLFLHGWQSTPGGIKPTYLKEHGHTVLNPSLSDDDFDEAVRIAQAEFDQHHPDVVAGSSRGGAVAMNLKIDVPLVLLCPAWKQFGTATTVKPGTIILHSRADEVVPFADSQELLRNSGLPESALIDVGTEHRLADEESLEKMLEAVERVSTPFQFGIGDLLVITALYAVLFGIMQTLKFSPLVFAIVAMGFTSVGLGQVFLFKGRRPRKASMIVGACFCVALGGAFRMAYGPSFYFDPLEAALIGAVYGYVAGVLISVAFAVIGKLGNLCGNR